VDFTPNPERKHTRGRRGKVFTGISDLQADFEMDRVRDDRGVRRAAGQRRALLKQKRVDRKERVGKAFRGKIPEEVRGSERAQFIARKARRRRLQLGLEGRGRRALGQTPSNKSIAVFNLKAAVLQFKRTGKLPNRSVDEIRMLDASGIDADALRRMIQKLLVRSGVEENPGPPADNDAPTVPEIVKTWKKKEKEKLNMSSSSSSSSSSSTSVPSSRQDEKRSHCGGNEPGDDVRFRNKKNRGRKNFASSSLLSAAGMLEADKKSGEHEAEKDKDQEAAEKADEAVFNAYSEARPAFVMRAGGFARPWYSGFGVPKTKLQLINAMLRYLGVWAQYIWGMGELPLWDPRDGAQWKPYGQEDDEIATPVFKGLVFSAFMGVMVMILVLVCTLFVWLCSFSSLLNWVGWILAWFVKSTAFIQTFGMLFRPVMRYIGGDVMMEVASPHFKAQDPHFQQDMRMNGMRYRTAIDRAVLADMDVHTVTVQDATRWWQKHMAVSWLLGSLFSWLEVNRMIRLIEERVHFVVSIRLADCIARGLARTRLDSYWEAETKARNLAATYDELKLGTQQVEGRNVLDDTVRYAAALYWAKAASDASLGNGGSPQSE
jgi:hypothetical protein